MSSNRFLGCRFNEIFENVPMQFWQQIVVMDRRRAKPPTRYDGGSWDLLRDPRHCDLSFCFREEAALHAARVVLHGDSLSFWLYVVGRIEFKLCPLPTL